MAASQQAVHGLREAFIERRSEHSDDISNRSDDGRASASTAYSADAVPRGAAGKVAAEVRRVVDIALPISLVDSAAFVASLVGVAEVGKLGYTELSALTLGNTFYNLTGLSIIVGMCTGMDGIGGQVYGAGQYAALGVLLQRASLACSLVCLPVYALWTQAAWLMQQLGQDPQVSQMATQYIWTCSPCLILSTVRMCIKSYFSSQGIVLPLTVLTTYSMIASPIYNYYFITWLDLRLTGAAIAYVVEEVTTLLLCLAMMVWLHYQQTVEEQTWKGFSTEALKSWGLYFQVAVPSMFMVCLDWWVLEVMVLLSGLGSSSGIQVAAMGLLFNAFTFIYYVCDGFGSAASTRVSNELGACNSRAAKLACSVSICMGLSACLFWCTVMYFTQGYWLRLFTNDAEVMQTFGECMPFVCLAVIGYSTNTIVSGVLRGSARSGLGLWINFLSLWLVGLPLAAFLALYLGLGPKGLWMGIAAMNLLQGGMLAVSVLRFDWRDEVKRSRSFVSLCTAPATPLLADAEELVAADGDADPFGDGGDYGDGGMLYYGGGGGGGGKEDAGECGGVRYGGSGYWQPEGPGAGRHEGPEEGEGRAAAVAGGGTAPLLSVCSQSGGGAAAAMAEAQAAAVHESWPWNLPGGGGGSAAWGSGADDTVGQGQRQDVPSQMLEGQEGLQGQQGQGQQGQQGQQRQQWTAFAAPTTNAGVGASSTWGPEPAAAAGPGMAAGSSGSTAMPVPDACQEGYDVIDDRGAFVVPVLEPSFSGAAVGSPTALRALARRLNSASPRGVAVAAAGPGGRFGAGTSDAVAAGTGRGAGEHESGCEAVGTGDDVVVGSFSLPYLPSRLSIERPDGAGARQLGTTVDGAGGGSAPGPSVEGAGSVGSGAAVDGGYGGGLAGCRSPPSPLQMTTGDAGAWRSSPLAAAWEAAGWRPPGEETLQWLQEPRSPTQAGGDGGNGGDGGAAVTGERRPSRSSPRSSRRVVRFAADEHGAPGK